MSKSRESKRRRPKVSRAQTYSGRRRADRARRARRRARICIKKCYLDTSDDDFRSWLIQRLDELDLTPRQLSILSGVNPGYFSMYLAGTRGMPPPRVLRAAASYLQVTYLELMTQAGYLRSEDFPYGLDLYKLSPDHRQTILDLYEFLLVKETRKQKR